MIRIVNRLLFVAAVFFGLQALRTLPSDVATPIFVVLVLVAGAFALKLVRRTPPAQSLSVSGDHSSETVPPTPTGSVMPVGTLLGVVAVAALGGWYWYTQHNVLPSCGDDRATSVVLKLVTDAGKHDASPEAAAVIDQSVKYSLDLIERGELSGDGNVRKCAAQLVATFGPDFNRFVAASQPDAFGALKKDGAAAVSLPLSYDLKLMDGDSSKFLASVPGSLPFAAFQMALTPLAASFHHAAAPRPENPASTVAPDSAEGVAGGDAPSFAGDWGPNDHVTSAIVGRVSVILRGASELRFPDAAQSSVDSTVRVTPVVSGAGVLLLQVRQPQPLPELKGNEDPALVYWILLLHRAPRQDEGAGAFMDMVAFTTPERPVLATVASEACSDDAQNRGQCHAFGFSRTGG